MFYNNREIVLKGLTQIKDIILSFHLYYVTEF